MEYDTTQNLINNENSYFRRLLGDKKLRQAFVAQQQNVKKTVDNADEASKASTNASSASSPVHIYPSLPETSGKASPETSEFEKLSGSVDKGMTTTSSENSDLEVINKSDTE